MLVDTHAHINLHAFKDDADEVMQRSLVAGVTVINVGTEYSTSKQAVDMLEKYPDNVYAAIGLHPSHTYDNPYLDENESATRAGAEYFNTSKYRSIAQHPKVVGIGECGLDYYRLPETDPNLQMESESTKVYEVEQKIKALQKEAFLQQIELARELDKALIIHCRPSKGTVDAYEDVLAIISNIQLPISNEGSDLSGTPPHEEGQGEVIVKNVDTSKVPMTPSQLHQGFVGQANSPSRGGGKELRFEIHSFTGPLEVAQKFIELGGYIGLNGIITFDKTGNMETVVKGVPLERIVLETDSPYLAPLPYRGKRNEPVYIEEVAKKIADWKLCTVEAVALQTSQNAKRLFKLE